MANANAAAKVANVANAAALAGLGIVRWHHQGIQCIIRVCVHMPFCFFVVLLSRN